MTTRLFVMDRDVMDDGLLPLLSMKLLEAIWYTRHPEFDPLGREKQKNILVV
jgi:hypothetical protein